jgi:hypothetical protein
LLDLGILVANGGSLFFSSGFWFQFFFQVLFVSGFLHLKRFGGWGFGGLDLKRFGSDKDLWV